MPWTIEEEESQQKLRDSKRYRGITPAGATNETCELRYEWQKQYHPNCNPVHENDFTKFFAESNTGVDENIRLVASGYFRDVWKVPDSASDSASASASARDGDDDSKERQRQWVASKTLRYKHAYTNRNFDRHRRDALTTERTTASPYTVDIYAHCVHTMVSEFSEEGSLSDLIWPRGELEGGESSSTCKLSMRERLGFALEAARGLAAVHFADGPQDPSTAHTDITPSQFLLVDGSLKLVSY
jgi:serine/threonine protein kinase